MSFHPGALLAPAVDWRATLAQAEADPCSRSAVQEEIERRLREAPGVVRALQLRQALAP